MIRKVVIDTNIYISAIFWGGNPREVVDLGRDGKISIFTSLEIQKEIDRILSTKFGLSDEETGQILIDFSTFTSWVKASRKIAVVDKDPDDDKFIECAVSAGASYVITGDDHLLELERYQDIEILNAADFLSIIAKNRQSADYTD